MSDLSFFRFENKYVQCIEAHPLKKEGEGAVMASFPLLHDMDNVIPVLAGMVSQPSAVHPSMAFGFVDDGGPDPIIMEKASCSRFVIACEVGDVISISALFKFHSRSLAPIEISKVVLSQVVRSARILTWLDAEAGVHSGTTMLNQVKKCSLLFDRRGLSSQFETIGESVARCSIGDSDVKTWFKYGSGDKKKEITTENGLLIKKSQTLITKDFCDLDVRVETTWDGVKIV